MNPFFLRVQKNSEFYGRLDLLYQEIHLSHTSLVADKTRLLPFKKEFRAKRRTFFISRRWVGNQKKWQNGQKMLDRIIKKGIDLGYMIDLWYIMVYKVKKRKTDKIRNKKFLIGSLIQFLFSMDKGPFYVILYQFLTINACASSDILIHDIADSISSRCNSSH